MTTAWQPIRFGDLYLEPSLNGLTVPSRARGSGVRFVNMGEIFSMDFIGDQDMELAPLPDKKPEKWLLRTGDLLFARQSLTLAGAGRCVLVGPSVTDRTFESHIIRVRLDPDRADPGFLYYYFKSSTGRRHMGTIIEQVAAAGIRASDLAELMIPLPAIEDQRKMATALGALSEVIELDRTLMQQILSFSRAYLSAAFGPDTRRVRLETIAEINPSRAKKVEDSNVLYLAIADVKDGTVTWPSPTVWSEAPAAARLLGQKGDVIWSRVRPNRRSHALLPATECPVVVSTGMVVLRPKGVSPAYLMAVCDSDAFADRLAAITGGTAYPTVDAADFSSVEVPLLSESERMSFDATMSPLWEVFGALEEETRELSQARDELVEMLIRGHVLIADEVA